MTASELFKAGQIQEAIGEQLKEVKAHPADHGKRLFLFELLAFAGDLDRARRQIDIVNYGDVQRDAAVLDYRKLLDAEEARRRLFRDGLKPQFLAEPPAHVQLRLDAVNRLRENRPAEARELVERASEADGPIAGKLNGTHFATLRDCDDLFGTVLEVMARGNYYWLPLEQIATLAMNPPGSPRDLLWIPARLETRDGVQGEVFLPALYPGSWEHADAPIRLGRATDWKTLPDGPVLGVGLRTFLVDDDAVSVLEWRQLELSN